MPHDVLSQLRQLTALPPVALLASAAVLVLLIIVAARLVAPPRYERKERLFSPAEWAFFRVLEETVGSEFRIFAKVRIADVLSPKQTANRRAWWRAFSKVSSKHVDYVLVDRVTGVIAAALELDDRTHDRQDRRARDAFVDRAFAQARVPLIRVKAGRNYQRRELAARISQGIAGRG
ncbi:MAG: DUF2726 domain-containing protein [Lamprocystis purpurea]|jgi:hypothetical protein|uniref:DUF2726 domain-containing protein n=1 Tax=Lamprocystis purpurea TaxID=61598 RepID=UPI00037A85BB|nr:DUF2726 domain-containing protein [Lamprocystis purpurea]MBV5272390.1 DUF2726 domain-containing protein [Lamprocystis purpurea]